MNFGQAVTSCFSQYATFSGRATRSEYWYFTLFVLIAGLVITFVAGLLTALLGLPVDATQSLTFLMVNIFHLALFVPSLAVSVRRLHDINRSGWWVLIAFTIIGILLLLYWAVLPSKDEEDRLHISQ